jgi:hypothetical protein
MKLYEDETQAFVYRELTDSIETTTRHDRGDGSDLRRRYDYDGDEILTSGVDMIDR